jgi:hypothetical protein
MRCLFGHHHNGGVDISTYNLCKNKNKRVDHPQPLNAVDTMAGGVRSRLLL